jgi:DUF4097 and DUF4098 domain-containing protein YvlB
MENQRKIEINGVIAGINVILIGVYLLLAISGVLLFGYLPSMLKLWPVILIAIGLDLIFKHYEIRYVGSALMTLLLILVIIASVPGAAGSGVRKVFGVPEEPVGWNWDRFISSWVDDFSDMKVIETKEDVRAIGFMPTDLMIKPLANVKRVTVVIKKSDAPSLKIRIDILDSIAPNPDPGPANDAQNDKQGKPNEKLYAIEWVETGNHYCNIYIDAAFSDTTNIKADANVVKFDIADDWKGNVDLGSAPTCDVTTKNLGIFKINTASGDVNIGNCSSVDIVSLSGDVKVGNLAQKSSISTASGNIEAGSIDSIDIKTLSGNVEILSLGGNSTVKTVSGELTINQIEVNASLVAETTSGNIEISNMTTLGKGTIKSISGNVSVTLLEDADITINADTLSGNLNIVGSENSATSGFDKTTTVGKGLGKLNIGTTSGNIEVKQ